MANLPPRATQRRRLGLLALAGVAAARRAWAEDCAAAAPTDGLALPPARLAALVHQVTETERAFARTMAERDAAAFARFLSPHAVFMGTDPQAAPLRGAAAVAAAWQRFFTAPQAPFSWAPDRVEVLADGTLAHSSGPVLDAQGRPIGRFHSIWRQESAGVWRIVFDRGEAERP